MTREQAKEILSGMTLEDCIKMWNKSCEEMNRKNETIHETEEEEWWEHLSSVYGAYYLVHDIANSVKEQTFSPYDEYFLFNERDCKIYSFLDKEEMMYILEDWFIEELINRN